MTHRIDVERANGSVTFELEGLVDAAGCATLEACVALARAEGAHVRIVLRVGTQVDRACLPALRALDAELVARSPFLASWIAGGRPPPGGGARAGGRGRRRARERGST